MKIATESQLRLVEGSYGDDLLNVFDQLAGFRAKIRNIEELETFSRIYKAFTAERVELLVRNA